MIFAKISRNRPFHYGTTDGHFSWFSLSKVGISISAHSCVAPAASSLLAPFVSGIVSDQAAVQAALKEPWSNGQTEGQNTKLKLVKRQMYGRAKLDLLRARLLGAP